MAAKTQRKRHLRCPPVVALVVASAGLFWFVLNPDRSYWIGYALIWGPLRRFSERADEFERQQRRDSFLVGLATVAVAGSPAYGSPWAS
jgi:hypothetical protein